MGILREFGRNHYNSKFEESVKEVPVAMSMMIDSMVNMVNTSRKRDLDITNGETFNDN